MFRRFLVQSKSVTGSNTLERILSNMAFYIFIFGTTKAPKYVYVLHFSMRIGFRPDLRRSG